VTLVKLTLAALVLVGSVCIVGCSGGSSDPATQPNTVEGKTGTGKGDKGVSGSPNAGINPNYQGSAAADSNRAGTAQKGGG
jgi:hypothetical protein